MIKPEMLLRKQDILDAMHSLPKGVLFTEAELDQVPAIKGVPTVLANESYPKGWATDRKQFVVNLGVLMAQTREGITGCYLDDQELVHVKFVGGYEELVNVRLDSYMAIIRDVAKYYNGG